MEYMLLLLLAIMTLITFIVLKSDPYAPGFLTTAMFFFSAMCLCYNVEYWDVRTDIATVVFIIVGITSFVLGNVFVQRIYLRRVKKASIINKSNSGIQDFKHNNLAHISKKLVILIFMFGVFVALLYFYEVIKIAGFNPSFVSMMYSYKLAGAEGARVSVGVNILVRMVKAFSTILIYYCINNVLAGKSFKSQLYLLVPLIPDLIIGILTGGRFRLLQLIIGPLAIYGFLYFVKYGKRIRLNYKIIFKVILIALISLLLFDGIKNLVGRNRYDNILVYVTEYFGGPLEMIDIILRGDVSFKNPTVFGLNSFEYFYKYVNRIVNADLGSYAAPGFLLSRTGINIGNVYTAFFKYYADFGYIGMICMSFFSGIIWSKFYYKCLSGYNNSLKILYAFVAHGILFQFYDEMTFSIFLSIDNWMTFFMIYLFDRHVVKNVKVR